MISKQQSDSTFPGAPEPGLPVESLFAVDDAGQISSWDAAAARISGLGAASVLGTPLLALFSSPEATATLFERARRDGSALETGLLVQPTAPSLPCQIQLTAVQPRTERQVGFLCSLRELPSRRVESLAHSEERFRLLVEAVRDYAIFMLDVDGRVASWNRGAQAIKGYSAAEIVGEHFSRFYTQADVLADKPGRELEIARREGRVEDEGFRVRKDGTLFWALVVITALFDDTGQLRGFAKITRDLSSRRRADEELRQSEERLRLLIESVNDHAMYMLDPGGLVRTWNSGAEALKGYTASDVIDQHFSMFFLPEDIANGKPAQELATALAVGEYREQGYRRRKDGSHFVADVRLTPIRDAAGVLLGFSKITHDLTARRKAEAVSSELIREQAARSAAEAAEARERKLADEAQAAAEAAREANRIKDEFLATVSHELRTPLNAIVGWASLLRGQNTDPPVSKALAVIHRNALAQQRIIDDLLDVSRMVGGRLQLEVAPTNFAVVVREALEVVGPAAAAKRITLDFSVPSTNCTLLADPGRLRQITWNLLSNAVKFSDPDGFVRVELEGAPEHVRLSVSDQGQGIASDFLPLVFDRFRQADGTITRRVGGVGLGLSIVRELVELHGGQVTADSPGPSRGATFKVTLPRTSTPLNAATECVTPQPAPQPSALDGVRVLVVDDDDDTRDLIRAMLTSVGATVETASSAAEGLVAFASFVPDVLVSDIGMPHEDGYRFLQQVRALPIGANTPAIALTAYVRPEDKRMALQVGFSRHMAKPLDIAQLIEVVAELVAEFA